jgi:hypothetical protein
MRPITELSNEEKAILLHQLLPTEIKAFLSNMERYAITLVKHPAEHTKNWADKGIKLNPNQWLKLAKKAADTISQKRENLSNSPEVFARELFRGYMGLFTVYYLQGYIGTCAYRFRAGITLLFDLQPAVIEQRRTRKAFARIDTRPYCRFFRICQRISGLYTIESSRTQRNMDRPVF